MTLSTYSRCLYRAYVLPLHCNEYPLYEGRHHALLVCRHRHARLGPAFVKNLKKLFTRTGPKPKGLGPSFVHPRARRAGNEDEKHIKLTTRGEYEQKIPPRDAEERRPSRHTDASFARTRPDLGSHRTFYSGYFPSKGAYTGARKVRCPICRPFRLIWGHPRVAINSRPESRNRIPGSTPSSKPSCPRDVAAFSLGIKEPRRIASPRPVYERRSSHDERSAT